MSIQQISVIDILSITAPIFMVIAIGYISVKGKFIPKEGVRYLGMFVINIALPCMLFKALSERSFAEIINPGYLMAYGIGSLFTLVACILIARKLRGKDLTHSTILAMGSSFSNTVFIGYPVVLQLLGPAAVVPIALSLIIENTVMLPITLAIADSGANKNDHFLKALMKALGRLSKNPIIISIVLGLLSSALSLKPPEVVTQVIDMFAMSSAAVALFFIGGILVGLKVNGMAADIMQIMLGKLIIHPLAVLAVLLVIPPIDPLLQVAAIVLASMPMFSIYPILGQKYGHEGTCAAALLATTVVSFISIIGCIWILGRVSIY